MTALEKYFKIGTNFFSKHGVLIASVILALVIKVALSFLPSFGFDMGSWLGWAGKLADAGPSNFYSGSDWTQYTPGYLYYLWLIGKLGITTEAAVKIPVIAADIITGLLIWSIVVKVNKKLAIISFFFYVFNPVVIFDSSVWGQIDGMLTLFLFTCAFFLIEKRNLALSVFFWSLAFLIKPQSIAIVPVYLLAVVLKKFSLREIFFSAAIALGTIIFLSLPFFPDNPILGLPQQILKMSQYYSYTSVFAFNIWSWVGFWKPDTAEFLGVALSMWGVGFFAVSVLSALWVYKKKIKNRADYYLLFAILSLCFFLFPTKVHERYLFPFFAFLLTSAGLSKSVNLFAIYIVGSLGSFLNLYYPYSYYYPDQLKNAFLYTVSESLSKIVGLWFLINYFLLLWWEKLPKFKLPKFSGSKIRGVGFQKLPLSVKTKKLILIAILVFAFSARVFNLGSPGNEYFDEVYHAFTAKVMMHADSNKAWEWWNPHPEGFAYEWTHPPLAKLAMVLGMKIFGENSFGYRIPGAIAGTLAVFLIYLIAKELFKDEAVGLLSAGIFSLDGLPLVMSRIGMNDSYLLVFTLSSIYLLMKNKIFLSALFFGLALSSKWSAIWAIPILFVLWLKSKKKFSISIFLSFIVLPVGIYLLTYLPMFFTGHDLSVWWEMQKQMWWYHTGLKATHPYQSSWWSWPILLRPIYLYTSEEVGGWVSRIYAMGNPVVFWFGLSSVAISFLYSFSEKNKHLAFIVFAYLIFFVPWAASPRIMFFYHYLPSVPFMAIAIGYILRRNPKLIFVYLPICLLVFIYFYPHWAGLNIPLWLDRSYYWISSWR